MAWRPHTFFGKILKGAAIAVGVVGSAALVIGTAGATIPAIGGVITAAGGVAGKVLQGSMKTVDAIGTAATNMVSGVTKEQRALIAAQKDESKAGAEKLTTINKLIQAGSTVENAASKVGVSLSSLAGYFGLPAATETAYTPVDLQTVGTKFDLVDMVKKNPVMAGIGALALLFIVPKLLKMK